MRVSILVDDHTIIVNDEAYRVNLEDLKASNIHAVQWHDDFGEIEFRNNFIRDENRWHREPNFTITELTQFQPYIDVWTKKKLEAIKLAEERRNADTTRE